MHKAESSLPVANIAKLPPDVDLETTPILKASTRARSALAELNGRAASLPNPKILIDTLALQEAKASSEIENIVTTQDELFQGEQNGRESQSAAAKEVFRYRAALQLGHEDMQRHQSVIRNNSLIEMFQHLKARENEDFRATPGTVIKNQKTGEIVHRPPQDANEIIGLMRDLEDFINADDRCDYDPLVKMALIHHQFESIHPFSDGNGRIGRILNVLYLVHAGLLDAPILYLSRHLIRTKPDYYRLLRQVHDSGDAAEAWREWVAYMLVAVEETSRATLSLVKDIRDQMMRMKHCIRSELPKIYSQDLLNILFRNPYTRIDHVIRELEVSRPTASSYLNALAEKSIVREEQRGRNKYYINADLVQLLEDLSEH